MDKKLIINTILCLLIFIMPATSIAAPTKIKDFKDFRSTSLASYSAAIIDDSSGTLLYGKRENEVKPVASITKIAGAYIFTSENPDLNKKVRMEQSDEVGGGRLRLPIGTTMRAKDFLYSSLIGSANNSATALARESGLSQKTFIEKMNKFADEAGTKKTNFVDACGISPDNRSSAYDLALIGRQVYQKSLLCQISSRPKYSFSINGKKGTKTISHTSPIISSKSSVFKIIAAKTGYLPEVGNNLLVKLENKKAKKAKIIIVTMGAKTKNSSTQDTTRLANWAFKNYVWK